VRRISLCLLAAFLPNPLWVSAQVFDLEKNRIPINEIHGPARFHTGDDPRWSDPDFNDSDWPLLRLDQSWNEQGYKGYSGFAWYRFRVVSPERGQNLALLASRIRTSYEIFANGQSIGVLGGMPPHARFVDGTNQVYSISLPAGSGNSILVAIRVWQPPHGPFFLGGGSDQPLLIGDANRLNEWAHLQTRSTFWDLSVNNLELVVFFVVGFAGLVLFLMRRQDREYLWFAAYQMIAAGVLAAWDWREVKAVAVHPWLIASIVLESSYRLCMLEFVRQLMKARRGRTYWVAVAAMAMKMVLLSLVDADWASSPAWDWIQFLLFLPYDICILLLLNRRAPEGERDGRFLLLPMGLWFLSDALINFAFLLLSPGNTRMTEIFDRLTGVVTWPFPMGLNDITFLFSEAAILSALLLRFVRLRRDEEQMKMEFEAASLVQQVLMPVENPEIPGFHIESLYRPAGKVGGDFFQVVPQTNGGALIAIGDVSGKGMPAAMTVSLLVGTLRTLAHYTHGPAEILGAMNQRMLARSRGGFTTCLVLRVDPDGSFTAANAGHLSPYLNGDELALDNGLPLGIAASAVYSETIFALPPGAQLTLLTDGVVEARSKSGELLGFSRTAALVTQSAEAIAAAAQAFGQNDDITVLTLSRTTV
jgi:hypothetical protein